MASADRTEPVDSTQIGPARAPSRLLMDGIEKYDPGFALPDGTVLANPPGGATRPAVVHLVSDTPTPDPQPRIPISWVQGRSPRWSNTIVLGALADP